jgi:Helix-turn-helix domain
MPRFWEQPQNCSMANVGCIFNRGNYRWGSIGRKGLFWPSRSHRCLNLARNMLAKDSVRVGEAGRAVGYESEAAFSRAYKAFLGHTPRDAKPAATAPQ